MPKPSRLRLFLVLSIGLISIAFGSIFVKLSQEAPSLVIAFFRMSWASAILFPFYLVRKPAKRSGSQLWLLAAGLALALHFAFWVSSLRYTSVAVSVLLVNTSPVLVALFSYVTFRERLTLRGALGITLAFLGSAVLFLNDLYSLGDWRGAALSLAGACMLGVYLVAGRRVRQQVSLIGYVYPTYLLAAVILGGIVWAGDFRLTGFSSKTYFFLFLLGLVPQCLGHTSYNWALKYLSATIISTVVLAEPILATLLAYWILREAIGIAILLGGVAVGLGIFLVSGWGIALRPKVEVAAAILRTDGKVWIQKRQSTDHLEGYWEFPGGKVDPDESPYQALRREIHEELGLELDATPCDPIHIQEYSYPEREVRVHFFLVQLDSDSPLGSGQWVRLDQLDQFTFPPANQAVIEKIRTEGETILGVIA
ncbi:EamA family transporter [Acidobacteria bacterium AH-259-O06]|nr:EamA family transporter [Acidobacteria bacterium AH-259-O06]